MGRAWRVLLDHSSANVSNLPWQAAPLSGAAPCRVTPACRPPARVEKDLRHTLEVDFVVLQRRRRQAKQCEPASPGLLSIVEAALHGTREELGFKGSALIPMQQRHE